MAVRSFQAPPPRPPGGMEKRETGGNLHLIGNNTRFLAPGQAGEFPNLASCFLPSRTRRLSSDWREHYGHGLLMAESSVDPRHSDGTMHTRRPTGSLPVSAGDTHALTAVAESLTALKELRLHLKSRTTATPLCSRLTATAVRIRDILTFSRVPDHSIHAGRVSGTSRICFLQLGKSTDLTV